MTTPTSAPPLPNTTAAAFVTYLNTYFSGDNGKKGGTVAGLNEPGATLGDQFSNWYTTQFGKNGNSYTLLQYEQAFIADWSFATLNNNIAAATTGGLSTAGNFANSIVPGLSAFYNSTLFGSLTKLADALSNPAFWLRAGEGLLGVILIAVGIARLTHAVPIATKIAGAVA